MGGLLQSRRREQNREIALILNQIPLLLSKGIFEKNLFHIPTIGSREGLNVSYRLMWICGKESALLR